LSSIPGSPPDLIKPPSGCKFHPRCAFATEVCKGTSPELVMAVPGHDVACYHSDQVMQALRKGQPSE
jgi:oligopeptide/dipeptide ABC transporter ATP-binding protein